LKKKKKKTFVSTNRYAALEIKNIFDSETAENPHKITQTLNKPEKRIPLPPNNNC